MDKEGCEQIAKQATEDIEKGLLSILGCVALTVLNCIWSGYVLSILWKWFIVGLGAPAISVTEAIGLSLFVWAISPTIKPDLSKYKFMKVLMDSFFKILLALGIGYVVHLFM